MNLGWRRFVLLLGAFSAWTGVGVYALPFYAQLVLPATGLVLDVAQPHGLDVELIMEYPYARWSFADTAFGEHTGRLSLSLLTYNAAIYLALVAAAPAVSWRWRLLFALTGLPGVFLFHVGDLAMGVESRILSVVQAEHYDFLADFGLWFSLVKFYNFLSIMAVKQIVLVGLFYLQWKLLPWRGAAGQAQGEQAGAG